MIEHNDEIDDNWEAVLNELNQVRLLNPDDDEAYQDMTIDENKPLLSARDGVEKRDIVKRIFRLSDWI